MTRIRILYWKLYGRVGQFFYRHGRNMVVSSGLALMRMVFVRNFGAEKTDILMADLITLAQQARRGTQPVAQPEAPKGNGGLVN